MGVATSKLLRVQQYGIVICIYIIAISPYKHGLSKSFMLIIKLVHRKLITTVFFTEDK
jgi:hypothetical protein